VRVACTPAGIELTFEDDGTPFNPLEARMPEPFTDIEHARIGGMGLPLIIKLSNELRYQRLSPDDTGVFRPTNRNVATLAVGHSWH
jgi:anti-sigma regulatory factor (Ser/Thr protein kinase)